MRKSAVVRDIEIHRLQPLQISKRWPVIRRAFQEGLGGFPLRDPAALPAILASLQSGQMQCWAGFAKGDNGPILAGMLFTTIVSDPKTRAKRLSVAAARSYRALHSDAYAKVLDTIEGFGREHGCDTIEMMTSQPRVRKMLEKAGYPPPMDYYIKEI